MSDFYDEADEITDEPRVYFGQLFTDAQYMYIKKGERKEMFDPSRHPAGNKRRQLKIDAVCNDSNGAAYTKSREIILEIGREWKDFILPSLKKLKVSSRTLDESWVKFEWVKTGRTYHSDYTGNDETEKTFKFLEFYADETTCKVAEAAHYSQPAEDSGPTLDETHPMPEDTPVDTGPTRADAAGFLDQFLILAGQDLDAFYTSIVSSPVLSKYFGETVEEIASCPEVVLAIGRAA